MKPITHTNLILKYTTYNEITRTIGSQPKQKVQCTLISSHISQYTHTHTYTHHIRLPHVRPAVTWINNRALERRVLLYLPMPRHKYDGRGTGAKTYCSFRAHAKVYIGEMPGQGKRQAELCVSSLVHVPASRGVGI